MKLRLLVLLLLATALPAAAARLVGKGVADGLGNRKVYQVCQDADGRIWAGLEQGGLLRYDPADGAMQRYPPEYPRQVQ